MTWHIDIERVSNGYIIRYPSDTIEDITVTTVITEHDTVDGKIDAAVEMLYEVADYFGLLGSKYDHKRLSIGTQSGSDYEDSIAAYEERTSDMGADGSSLGHPESENRTDVYGSEEQDAPLYERAEDEA